MCELVWGEPGRFVKKGGRGKAENKCEAAGEKAAKKGPK
jgi:hypothetical protein